MNRKGITTTIVILIVAVLVLVAVFGVKQFTGDATLTEGAVYGPIFPNSSKYLNYVDCDYIGDDDGWSVLKKGKIQYRDRTSAVMQEIEDYCVTSISSSSNIVQEFDCVGTYKKERRVKCPPETICREGICIPE